VLVGATQPAGVYSGPGELNPYGQFLKLQPAEILGGSILVFEGRFDLPAASAWSHLNRIWGLDLTKQLDEAIAEANAAVKLAPRMVYAHYALGYLLARRNQKVRAREEYQTALRLARTVYPEYQWYWVPFVEKHISGL
jgi:tetratricopeptide (TPR) repeat protein